MCSAGTVLGRVERIRVSMRAVSGFIPSRGGAQSQLALPRQLAWGAHVHGLFHNCVNLVLVLLPALHHTRHTSVSGSTQPLKGVQLEGWGLSQMSHSL